MRVSGGASYGVGRDAAWRTVDRCGSTTTYVTRGIVRVHDKQHQKTFIVRAGRTDIVRVRDQAEVPETTWTGEIAIRRGEESEVYLEVANSSSGEVLTEGEFADDTKAPQAPR